MAIPVGYFTFHQKLCAHIETAKKEVLSQDNDGDGTSQCGHIFGDMVFRITQDLSQLASSVDPTEGKNAKQTQSSGGQSKAGSTRKRSKRRRRTVTGERVRRQYRCTFPGCSRVFSGGSTRKTHIASVHLNAPKRYSCTWPACGMASHYQKSIWKHVLAKHLGIKYNLRSTSPIMARMSRQYVHDSSNST